MPSRSDIEAYDELSRRVEAQVADINARYGTPAWRPIHLLKQSFPPDQLALLYRMADLCLVGSLQDGMNLVAKEYVASQVEDRGVLVLSEFAGAAEEMQDAVLINPYDPERTGLRIRDALLLPMDERRDRLVRLRAGMGTIYEWMQAYFTRWGQLAV